jgi:hypothetical protein
MVTSSAPNATRVVRTLTTALGSDRNSLLARRELPDVDADDRQHTRDHPKPVPVGASHLGRESFLEREVSARLDQLTGPDLDRDRVARAVEELLQALAPTSAAQIRVEVSFPSAPSEPTLTPLMAVPNPTTPVEVSPHPNSPDGPGSLAEASRLPELNLDLGGRHLWVDGRTVELTRREFDLLAYLQRRRGVALSRRELMDTVWGTSYLDGDRTIDVHVRRLRMKLGRHAERLSTLRGFGYRFD